MPTLSSLVSSPRQPAAPRVLSNDDWFAQQGAPQAGPPPGMSQEAWADAEGYLNRINPGRQQPRLGGWVPGQPDNLGAPSGGGAAPGGASGIMAPRQSAEDQRLLQDPAFRAQYHAWVDAQGPGAADWATPTAFQQQRQQGGAPGGAPAAGGAGIPAFIAEWQRTHAPGEGIGPLAEAIRQQFPGVTRFMYGDTPSGNELNINGEKYKVLGGENSSSPYWYVPGTDDSAGGMGGEMGGAAGGPLAALQSAPGYQFRLAEGAKALERSAAAKGTLLTGGTLKGLTRYGQDYASGEYNNRYNQLFGLAGLGANAAAGQAGANTAYGNSAGDLLTQRGNAQAGATVGSGNAWNQGIANATNIAQQYYLARLYGTQPGSAAAGGGTSYMPGATVPGMIAPSDPPYTAGTVYPGMIR